MLSDIKNNTTRNIIKSLTDRLLGNKNSDPDDLAYSKIPTSIVVAHEALINLDALSIAGLAKDLWPQILDFCSPAERIRMRVAFGSSGKAILDNYTVSNEKRLYTIVPSLWERVDEAIDAETQQLVDKKTGWIGPCSWSICFAICMGFLLYVILFSIALANYSQTGDGSYNLIMNIGIGSGAFALFCACIVAPVVACMTTKVTSRYNEFELFLMTSPKVGKEHLPTREFMKNVHLYITADEKPYINFHGKRPWHKDINVTLPIHIDPALFDQTSWDPKKCTDRYICRRVFEALEKKGFMYARSHILNKPISTLPPFEEKTENSAAYNKILKSFPPETSKRKMMFSIRNQFLKSLENQIALQQEPNKINDEKSVLRLA